MSLGDFKDERRMVRYWGADGPPANFKVVPETMFVSGGVEHLTAARAVTASSDTH